MYTVPGTAPPILQDQAAEMDRVLPPVTTFGDPVGQSPSSYRGLLEAQMEAEVTEVEGRMRDLETRGGVRTGYENRNYEWTQDDNQRYQQQHHHQTYLPSASPGSGQWPDVVPNDLQPSSLQGHGVIMGNYPLNYNNNGVNDSQQWDYQRTANNQLLLTNTGLNSNMDGGGGGGMVHHVPPNITNVPPQSVVVGRVPSNRRCRGHRGGRQREKTPPFESDNERRQWEKERRKKDIHNKIEQRRRYNINDRIDDLGILLRKGGLDIRQNKGAILRETIAYIRELRNYLSGLEKKEEEAEELTRTNEGFLLRIQRMHNFLQSKGYQPPNDLYSRPTGPSVQDHQEWPSSDHHLPVYPTMKETPQRGNATPAPYPEVPLVKQESSRNLTPLYAPMRATGAQGGGEGLHSICEQPQSGYYQTHGQYQF